MMRVWQPTKEEIEKTNQWGTWTKEESEFDWSYDETETCYILEGEASVMDNAGHSVRFKAGDMVEFKKGLTCTWKINKAIRKRYNFS
jgi:uncharacterized cupin superfamily protein